MQTRSQGAAKTSEEKARRQKTTRHILAIVSHSKADYKFVKVNLPMLKWDTNNHNRVKKAGFALDNGFFLWYLLLNTYPLPPR